MSQPECGNCARPTTDGAEICFHCSSALSEALRSVPGLLDDLLTTLSKQDRLGTASSKRGKGSEQPLPVRLDIGPVIAALGNTLTTWARDLVERHGWDVPDPPRRVAHNGQRGLVLPASTAQVDLICYAATFLADHAEYLRQHPAALEVHRSITRAIETTQLAVDRPEIGLFIGACECGADLYSDGPGSTVARCARCGTTCANVAERWDRALLKLRGYPATASFIAGCLGDWYGQQVTQDTIRKWHQREELTPVDWVPLTEGGQRTVPRFRIGAVLDRASRSRPRKAG